MEPSCSSSMVKDKLGWTLLSTWRKSVADSALGILTRVSSTYLLFQLVLYIAHENTGQ